MPAGMRVDFGGVAKGRFVDRFASALSHWPGGCVDAGGDLRLWGVAPHGERWTYRDRGPVAAGERPARRRNLPPMASLASPHRGLSPAAGTPAAGWFITSSTRALSTAGDGARSVTVVARDVTAAEVATKALMVATTEVKTDDFSMPTVAVVILR